MRTPARTPDVEIFAGRAAIEQLEFTSRELGPRTGTHDVFNELPLLLIAAAAAEASGSEPLLALTRDEQGRVRSILPLRMSRAYGTRLAQGMSAPLGQYSDVVGEPLSPNAFAAIARQLRTDHGIDLMLFRRVRDDSGLADALSVHGQLQNAATTAPYIDLEAFGSFDEYEASFSKQTRRRRRQQRNKLAEDHGPIEFSVLQGAASLEAVDQAIAWKHTWLSSQGLKSPVFDKGPWQEAVRKCTRLPHAAVSALRAGDRLIAVELGFLSRGVYTSYLGAFEPELSRYGVGQEQLRQTIAWAFEAGADRFDLMPPCDDYKLQLIRNAGTATPVEDYAVPLSTLGRGMAEVRRYARPAARALVLNMRPEVRAVSALIAKPAAIAVTALGVAALMAE